MEYIFCGSWWQKKKCPIDIISEEQAQYKHSRRDAYSVVVKNDEVIQSVIDFTREYIIVWFMDEYIRPYLMYEFQVENNDILFLKSAIYNQYIDQKKKEMLIFNFNQNGNVIMEKNDYIIGEMIEKEIISDISSNWDKYPDFKDYTNILQVER